MADKEKYNQLDEIFSDDVANNSLFSINLLLGAPKQFLNFCYDFADSEADEHYLETMDPSSPKYDRRVDKHFVENADDLQQMKKFFQDHIDYIDLNRATLLAYSRLSAVTMDVNNSTELKKAKSLMLTKLKKILEKYSKENTVIYSYESSRESKDGLPDITQISSNELLGFNLPNYQSNLGFITEQQFKKNIKYFTLDTAKELFGDNRIFSSLRLYFMDLYEQHPELTDQEKVQLLFKNKCFRNTLNPGKYILTLNYGIIDKLKNSEKEVSLEEFVEAVEAFRDVNARFTDPIKYQDPDFKDDFAGRNFLVEFSEIGSSLSEKFLEADPSNFDRFMTLGVVSMENFHKYIHLSKNKETSLLLAAMQGLIDDQELEDYCNEFSIDMQSIHTSVYNLYLESKGVRKNDINNYPLDDELFRKIIPKNEYGRIVSYLIKNATKNPDSTIPTFKLNLLINDGMIDESFIKDLYINNEISYQDIQTVSNIYSDYDLRTLYGFEQSTTQLVAFYKYLYEDVISESMKAEGDKYEEKPIFVDPDEYLLKQNYEFQRKLFRESPKTKYTKVSELEDQLDYLILYPGIAKHLYHQGLIDVTTLKERIDDTGELPEKRQTTLMLLNGEIAEEDLPTLVKGTSLEDNAYIMTQLYESGDITYREIIEKYLAGNISYANLLLFANGRDLSSAFNQERYLGLFSNAINTANEDKIDLFSKYKKAYYMFMPADKIQKLYSKQKAELAKCHRKDKYAEYYRKSIIDGKNILDLLNDTNIKSNKYLFDTLADLILTQDLKVEDCELLFKDTSSNSHKKRDRLEFIFMNYDIPDEIKMKTMLDTYIENSDLDLINYDYLLKNCLERASEDPQYESDDPTTTREKREEKTEKREQEVMPYPLRYRDIISIDPRMTTKVFGSKIMFHSEKYGKYLFEQMYTTKKKLNSQLTTHATYIVNDDLVNEIYDQLFSLDKDGNITDFDYKTLIDTCRNGDRSRISKTLHKSTSWLSRLRTKITEGTELTETILVPEDDIEIS